MILVTGARGVLGRFVVDELLRRNELFSVFRRRTNATFERPAFFPSSVDVLDFNQRRRRTPQISKIIHLASPRSLVSDVVLREEIAFLSLLLSDVGATRFAIASSQGVYGVPESCKLLSEDWTVPKPVSWYDIGKLTNEYTTTALQAKWKYFDTSS
jgi:nucleoside-diphosphate-sugar epimerase